MIELTVIMSNDKRFVEFTLAKQHLIAVQARDIQNKPRILYQKNFVEKKVIMVGNIRVSVDSLGNEAILSEGAQKCFSLGTYYEYTRNFPSVVLSADKVMLLPK